MKLLGTYNIGGSAWGVTLSADGQTAYVVDDFPGLKIIDVSTGSSPALLGTYDTSSYALGVTLSDDGQTAYVADARAGLQIIDVSNNSSPTLLGTYDTSGYARGVTLSTDGQTAYVADSFHGLKIIDVSTGSSPVLLGTYDSGYARGVTVSADGETAYVAGNGLGLKIIDVSNSSSPTLLGTYNTSGGALGVTLSADGQTAYVADSFHGLKIIDVSTGSSPVLLGTYDTSGYAKGVTISADGQTAYVVDSSDGLQIIDVSTGSSPVLLGTYNTSGSARGVTLSADGQRAYVLDSDAGLQIIDLNLDPTAITLSDNTINENHNGAAVGTLTVTDPNDNNGHTLTLSGTDKDVFEIVDGQLKLKDTLSADFETKSSYAVTVTVTDSGDLTYSEDLTVTVNNVNESPIAISLSSSTVDENSAGAVVGTLSTTDIDSGDSHTYALSGTDKDSFEIVDGELKLKDSVVVDYESKSSYSLTVTATDAGGLSVSQDFILSVTDVNEAPLKIEILNSDLEPINTTTDGFVDDYLSSQKVAIGSTVQGSIGFTQDADWFAVDLIKDRRYQIDWDYPEEGSASDLPALAIYDSQGELLPINQEGNSFTCRPAESETYYLSFADSSDNEALFDYSFSIDYETFNHSFNVTNPSLFGDYYDDVINCLDSAVGLWAKHIIQTGDKPALIEIDVTGEYQDGSLARARSEGVETGEVLGEQSVLVTSVQNEILSGVDDDTTQADAYVNIDLNSLADFWFDPTPNDQTDDVVPYDKYDFITIMQHEFGHALGFTGYFDYEPPPSGMMGLADNDLNGIFKYDTFIDWDESLDSFVFTGSHANQAYSDLGFDGFLPLHSEGNDGGSDLHHYGSEAYSSDPLDLYLMDASGNYGTTSSVSSLDIGVLKDLGYQINEQVDFDNEIVESQWSLVSIESDVLGGIVGTIDITDPDSSDTHVFTLSGSDSSFFEVVDDQLKLKSTVSADYNIKPSYSITVIATDSGGLNYSQQYLVLVDDVNDVPTAIGLSSSTVDENSTGVVVGTLTTTDPGSGDSHTYALSGTDQDSFEIVDGQLKLKSTVSADYETKSSYTVTVTTTDSGSLTYSEDFTVTVNDVNEAPTAISLDKMPLGEGTEFRVNTEVSGRQNTIGVIQLSDGGFVVLGADLNQGLDALDVGMTRYWGRHFNANGLAHDTEFQWSLPEGAEIEWGWYGNVGSGVKVSGGSNGFVFVWHKDRGDGNFDIFGQQYDSEKNRTGNVFEVSSGEVNVSYKYPKISGFDDGSFIVSWVAYSEDGGAEIYGQLYENSGGALGEKFHVSAGSEFNNYNLTVTSRGEDGFTVIWTKAEQINSDAGVQWIVRGLAGQHFDETGNKSGEIFDISGSETQGLTKAATLSNGNIVVVWLELVGTANTYDKNFYGQVIDNLGNSVSDVFTVDTNSIFNNHAGHGYEIEALVGGGFVVTWTPNGPDTPGWAGMMSPSDGQDGSSSGIIGRVFSKDGDAISDEFAVNTYTDRSQTNKSLVGLEDGGFVAFWTSYKQDGSDAGVYGQRFDAFGNSIELADDSIAENSFGAVVGTFTTTDIDSGDSHTYTLSGTDQDSFEIVNAQLKLKATVTADYETKSSYSVTVTTIDSSNLTYSKDFTVSVNDLNEAPTAISLSSSTIDENSSGAVVGTLTTTDPDSGDSNTYALSGTDKDSFEIVDGQLKLKDTMSADYETKTSHVITVTATDSGNLTYSEDFTISVNDVNDLPTSITLDKAPLGLGSEFRVNTAVSEGQIARGAIKLDDGGFMVLGITRQQALDKGDPYTDGHWWGQVYDAQGLAKGSNFHWEQPYINDSAWSKIAGQGEDGFVLAWHQDRADDSGSDIFVQRYGAPEKYEFSQNEDAFLALSQTIMNNPDPYQVSGTGASYTRPQLVKLVGGSFVVGWNVEVEGDSGQVVSDIYGQRFDALGSVVGSEFQINQEDGFNHSKLTFTSGKTGGYTAIWTKAETVSDTEGNSSEVVRGLLGQRFDASGNPSESIFLVAETEIEGSKAATLSNGNTVVVWLELAGTENNYDKNFYGRIFDQTGRAVTDAFEIDTNTTFNNHQKSGYQIEPLSEGGFVVTWIPNGPDRSVWGHMIPSDGQDGSKGGVFGRIFAADGSATTDEFAVNTYVKDYQYNVSLVSLADGGFVSIWVSHRQDGSSSGVYGQRFDAEGNAIELVSYAQGADGDILENTAGAVVGTLVAEDTDIGDIHTFTLSGADAELFEVIEEQISNWREVVSFSQLKLKDTVSADYEIQSSYSVTVTATDSGGLSYNEDLTLSVTDIIEEVNEAPIVHSPIVDHSFRPTTEIPSYAYDIASVFSDPEDDTLIYTAQLKDLAWGSSPLPDWLTLNPDTGLLSGTPGGIDTGTLTIEVTATEVGMDGLAASDTFSLDVQSIAPSTGDIPFTFKTDVISASAASEELYDGVDYTGGSNEALIKLMLNADMAGFTSAELSHISSIAGAALDMNIDWSQFESISDLTGNVGEMFHVENLVGTGMFLGANTKDANPSLLDGLAISSLRTDEPALTLVDNITPTDEREIDLPSTLDLATIYLNPINTMIETSLTFGGTVEGNQGAEDFVQSESSIAIFADRVDATVMTTDNELLNGLTMNLWDNGVDLNQDVAINHGEIEVEQTIDFDAIKLSDPDAYDMDLTIGDALDVLRHIVKLETLTGAAYHAADVDNDDDIDIGDALDVLRHIVKLDTIDTFDLIDEMGNRVTQLEDSNPSIPPQWTLIANGDVDQSGSFAAEYTIAQIGTSDVVVESTVV